MRMDTRRPLVHRLNAILAILAILVFLAAAAPPALAETYKWVDQKGVVNYSNNPPPAQAAKRQVVEERISIVAPDPALGPAIAAMNARAAQRAQYEEADWARRQSLLQASQASYAGAGADCAYRANCEKYYDLPGYYYPYSYGGAVFNAIAWRRPPHVAHHVAHHGAHHRAQVSPPHAAPRGTGGMRAGRGSLR